MISWRARRYLVAFLVLGIVIGGVGFFAAWRLLPASTCSDGKKNQGELGVDCGGPCVPCELRNPKPITVFWVKGIASGENSYDAAAQIRNENEVLASPRMEYEFTLFDEFGPVARRSGSTFLLAQEKFVLGELGLSTTRIPLRAEFRITGVEWEVRPDLQPVLIVERREYGVEQRAGRRVSIVEATIANRSPLDLARVGVGIALFDRAGNVVGINQLLLEELPAGGRKGITSSWPIEIPSEISSVEIQPRVNVFDSETFVRPH